MYLIQKENIILDHLEKDYGSSESLSTNIVFDEAEWKMPDEVSVLVEELSNNTDFTNEDKILLIYDKLCKSYIYDDNVISYIQKIDVDKFALPDWYGKDVSEEWEANREKHNRRVCYEVSRYLAKAIVDLFQEDDNYNVCILYDQELTHYFVGLICNEYSITLDLDDFNNIKDLTRLKTGLTAEGIVILEDNEGKFKTAIDKFNMGRSKHATLKMEDEVENASNDLESQRSTAEEECYDIVFLNNVIEILKEKYDIDSQGLYEYIKEIVDIRLGPEVRTKVWKKLEGHRYTRCLLIELKNKTYIIDSDNKELRLFNEEELEGEDPQFILHKKLSRDWETDRYNGE